MSYVVLTFTISWGGMLGVIGPANIPGRPGQVEAVLPLAILALLAGPSICGPLLTGMISGWMGLGALTRRLLLWRVGVRWYLVALLLAPMLMTAILLALSTQSAAFIPAIVSANDRGSILRFGIVVALAAGVFEEVGWTGFAVPALRQRFGVLATGLGMGLVWALWHVLPALWMSGTVSGPFALTSYMLDPFLFLVAFRVLMVWVYDRTGSLLIAMLMHASLTASARILSAPAIAGAALIEFDLTWAVAVSGLAAIIIASNGRGRTTPMPLIEF